MALTSPAPIDAPAPIIHLVGIAADVKPISEFLNF